MYFVIDPVRKLLDTPSYRSDPRWNVSYAETKLTPMLE